MNGNWDYWIQLRRDGVVGCWDCKVTWDPFVEDNEFGPVSFYCERCREVIRRITEEQTAAMLESRAARTPTGPSPADRRYARMKKQGDGTVTKGKLRQIASEPCIYCGSTHDVEADHMDPIALGGLHSLANLAPACSACNKLKKDRPFIDWVATLPEKFRRRAREYYFSHQGRVPEQHALT